MLRVFQNDVQRGIRHREVERDLAAFALDVKCERQGKERSVHGLSTRPYLLWQVSTFCRAADKSKVAWIFQ